MNRTEIHVQLQRLATASIPARHIRSRPITKDPKGPKHTYIPWDVTAAALNFYLGPDGWNMHISEMITDQTSVHVRCSISVMDEENVLVTRREATGSANLTDEDAAGQATAAAFKRAAIMLGYNTVSKPVCTEPCCKPEEQKA